LSIPYSNHISITSKNYCPCITQSKMIVIILTLFGAKCSCLISQNTLTLERVFRISHLFVRWVVSLEFFYCINFTTS
jgi:hypothetical protein